MIKLSKSDYDRIVAHAQNEAPIEACGLIAGELSGDDKIVKKVYILTNVDHAEEHFTLDPKEQLFAVKPMSITAATEMYQSTNRLQTATVLHL